MYNSNEFDSSGNKYLKNIKESNDDRSEIDTLKKIIKEKDEVIHNLELQISSSKRANNRLENLSTKKSLSFKTNTNKNIEDDVDFEKDDPFLIFDELVNILDEVKELLKKLSNLCENYHQKFNVFEQDHDDIVFYQSIIFDSKNFYLSSYKVRKDKLIYDLNQFIKLFNFSNIQKVMDINPKVIEFFRKLFNKYDSINKNNIKLTWMKSNKTILVKDIRFEFNRVLSYHKLINTHFKNILTDEILFFNLK